MILAMVVFALLAVNAGLEIGLRAIHLACARRRAGCGGPATIEPRALAAPAFVSVHVATHAEPPELVIATLHSLARSNWRDFEVIILDNNTADPALWRPVAAAALALGCRFRFLHLDGVRGAKAGALNECLARADPRTTHVAIVDADYQVSADFLSDAIATLTAARVDYVQFPQAYRAVSPHAAGVERELGDYFACFAGDAGGAGSMLPTGTLSLFALPALRAIGGWSSASITEDAEIGVRLQAAGYRGRWVGRARGHGLLPLDFAGLRTQRARWVAGNVQVLRPVMRQMLAGRRLPLPREDLFNLVVQLTAWLSLWWLPALALATYGLFPALPLARPITLLAGWTIYGSAALTALRMASADPKLAWTAYLPAYATKLALTWTSATAWLPALLGQRLAFRRTQKAIIPGVARGGMVLAAASLAYAVLALAYLARAQPIEALACALLASVWPCARIVDRNLRESARRNPELLGLSLA